MPEDTGDVSSMRPSDGRPRDDRRGRGDSAPNTLLNGVIGGLAGVLLSGIPFSTVLGGGIAGYLEGGDYADGAKVGAIAGLVAFVPFVLFLWAVLLVLPIVPDPAFGAGIWLLGVLVVGVASVYTVGLSVLGGVLGIYVRTETEL